MNTATNPATLQYIGEHLLPGQFGYFFTLLSLVASLVASFAFAKAFFSNNIEEEKSWNKLAKIAFHFFKLSKFRRPKNFMDLNLKN